MKFMESLKKVALLILAVVLTSAGTVSANDADESDIQVSVRHFKHAQRKALITITNLAEDQRAVLRIKNKRGDVLHREVINQKEVYARRYDFSKLPNGEYTVEVRTSEGVIKEAFALKSGKANPLYFKPAIQLEPDLIKVAFMNRISSPVSLKLYDHSGRVLYEESVPSQGKFAKSLDTSRLRAGLYSLSILGDNYVYSKSIQVK